MSNKLVICEKCLWVHFSLSRDEAVKEVNAFNDFFNTLDEQKRIDYYGNKGASIVSYEHCFRCGGSYKNFRDALDEEIPIGSTIQPIIKKDD